MHLFQCTRSNHFYSRVLSLCIAISLICLLAACSPAIAQSQPTPSATHSVAATPSPTPSPTPSVPTLLRPDIERGMIYPQWGSSSYGIADTAWQQGIKDIKTQTASTWLEIPVLLQQDNAYSTSVWPGSTAPSLDAFASGIHSAIALGYHVFFIPLLGVNTPGGWAGIIQISAAYQQAWFNSYWNALKPYAEIAQENGVEQMAIGTELVWMEDNAPASLWNQLISRVQSVFKGALTYDMNWYPSLTEAPASWLKNPALSMIGLSEYIPLSGTPGRVDPSVMPDLWRNKVGKLVDTFSSQVGKPVILSEIGYRYTADALYSPYSEESSAPIDEQEQAGAYAATLINVFADSHIVGVFFWGWTYVGKLGIAGRKAAQVVYRWYTKTTS
jgi:hypothetical protein